jgi:hypothetical protein
VLCFCDVNEAQQRDDWILSTRVFQSNPCVSKKLVYGFPNTELCARILLFQLVGECVGGKGLITLHLKASISLARKLAVLLMI